MSASDPRPTPPRGAWENPRTYPCTHQLTYGCAVCDPRPTPPERVPVEAALRAWREVPWPGSVGPTPWRLGKARSAGDALAAALEATAAERDEWKRAADQALRDHAATSAELDRLTAERDRAHATLREIAGIGEVYDLLSKPAKECARLARDRLTNP